MICNLIFVASVAAVEPELARLGDRRRPRRLTKTSSVGRDPDSVTAFTAEKANLYAHPQPPSALSSSERVRSFYSYLSMLILTHPTFTLARKDRAVLALTHLLYSPAQTLDNYGPRRLRDRCNT